MTTQVDQLPATQRAIWEVYVDSSEQPTKEGWHYGWCPKCTPLKARSRKPRTWTAEINFKQRKFRCISSKRCSGTAGKDANPATVALREAEAWAQGYKSHAEVPKQRGTKKANPAGDKVIAQMLEAHPSVDQRELPSPFWAGVYGRFLITKTAPKDGEWSGYCPLHAPPSRGKATAVFNFRSGYYRCLADSPCHAPKKAMSLVNLRAQVETADGQ